MTVATEKQWVPSNLKRTRSKILKILFKNSLQRCARSQKKKTSCMNYDIHDYKMHA